MKVKILLLTLSMFFASMQFFGQNINLKSHTNLNSLASSSGNLKMSEAVNTQAGIKSTATVVEALRLKLTCNATSYSDEAIVVFNNSDPTQGAAKLMSMYSTAPELWSVKNGLKYSISFLGGLDSTISVPITAKAGLAGNYTITASQMESFGANIEISLEDRVLGTVVNLRNTPVYTYQINLPATIGNRFYLHFKDVTSDPNKLVTSVSEKDVPQSFNMYAADGAITINSLEQQSGKIVVFDMLGHKIATGLVEAGAKTQIDMRGKTGVYIVSVLTGKGRSNTKVIVN